jgi:hypothetical protein
MKRKDIDHPLASATASSSFSASASGNESERKISDDPLFRCKTCPKESLNGPLTVFARHNIIRGREQEFEQWVMGERDGVSATTDSRILVE